MLRPEAGVRLSAQRNPAARDLIRHAVADTGGNTNLARSWAKFARTWPTRAPRREVLDELSRIGCPTLLLWADQDDRHPLDAAEEALDLLPDGQLRVVEGAGFLMAYDDPVVVAREMAAFLV
jgi:pimeloyl-ACP methyl ester carboxylesterase